MLCAPAKPNLSCTAAVLTHRRWQADLSDAPSLEKAMQNSYGVFAVTNYWYVLKKTMHPSMCFI